MVSRTKAWSSSFAKAGKCFCRLAAGNNAAICWLRGMREAQSGSQHACSTSTVAPCQHAWYIHLLLIYSLFIAAWMQLPSTTPACNAEGYREAPHAFRCRGIRQATLWSCSCSKFSSTRHASPSTLPCMDALLTPAVHTLCACCMQLGFGVPAVRSCPRTETPFSAMASTTVCHAPYHRQA